MVLGSCVVDTCYGGRATHALTRDAALWKLIQEPHLPWAVSANRNAK